MYKGGTMVEKIKNIIRSNITLSENDILEKFCEGATAYKPNFYCYKKGKIPVLLMAHVDTCQDYPLFEEDTSPIYKCLGADDRVGVSIIEYLLEKYDFHFLLTNEEEKGCKGAKQFVSDNIELEGVNIIIGLDRRGTNHYVTYHDRHQEKIQKFAAKFGLQEQKGTNSDCKIISEGYGIAHLNLSVGYYNQHTIDEYINIHDVISAIKITEKMLIDYPKDKIVLE